MINELFVVIVCSVRIPLGECVPVNRRVGMILARCVGVDEN